MRAALWARAGCLVAVACSLAAVPTADAASLRLDAGFGEGGIAQVRFGIVLDPADTRPLRPVRQPDGKLLVAAARTFDRGNSQILLARFTRRGRPDPTFGHGGRERLGLRWNFDPQTVHVQRDGRILVLGAAGFGPFFYPAPGQFGLVRLLPDGSRDSSFGTNGFVAWNPPWRANASSLYALPGLFSPQADGSVLAAGVVTELVRPSSEELRRIVFVRFNQNGSLDESFGRRGVIEGPDGTVSTWAFAALPDGRIVALSLRAEGFGPASWWLHGFSAGGEVDRGFGQDGSVRLGLHRAGSAVNQLLPARDGSLLVLGTVDPAHPAGSAAAVRRILPGGQLDARFGTACDRPGPRTGALGGAATSDGRIIATARGFVRHARIDSFVFRYGPNGCVAGRPLRLRALSVGPPLLRGHRSALVASTYGRTPTGFARGLALIGIRR
jgi:uncharacterized delta-60 repeat protein